MATLIPLHPLQPSLAVFAPVAFLMVLAAVLVIPVGVVAVIYAIVPFFKAIGFVVRQVFGFLGGEIGDALRIVGALITQVVLVPLVLVNILIGRWSAAAHYGRAVSAECKASFVCLYRMVIGHPARLLCLNALTEGLEKRIPAAVAAAPTADAPSAKRAGQFEGYQIIGSLPGGGSGGKLYIAEPDTLKRAIFERARQRDVRQVVIKTFSLRDGSSLPQIVRESRSLDAAKRLGLVLDHELTDERFYYVMRYVPGDSLALVTQRLHAAADGAGLDGKGLASAMGYGADLLRTLDAYHSGGLWHKDVKPDNIIVDGREAHLVDFGLVTPLRSAMTLTTHGTEYFRDPEMVRLALKGVKVDQVDGAKFDIYAAAAVLFSVVENSFPAHGGLSQIGKRCPEALRWIVRRGMAEYDKRYATAGDMLADLECVRRAADPFALRPADLPSMGGIAEPAVQAAAPIEEEAPLRRTPEPVAVGAGSGAFAQAGAGPEDAGPGMPFGHAGQAAAAAAVGAVGVAGSPLPRERRRPRLRVDRWWTGGYVTEDSDAPPPASAKRTPGTPGWGGKGFFVGVGALGKDGFKGVSWERRAPGVPAREQVERAKERVRAARDRARARLSVRRGRVPGDFRPVNVGVGFATLLLLAAVGALFFNVFGGRSPRLFSIYSSRGDARSPAMSYAVAELPDEASLKDSAKTAKRASRTYASRNGLVVNGKRVSSIGPGTAAPVSGERALVISDIDLTPVVTAAVKRLEKAGFTLLGNCTTAGPGEREVGIQLEAEARRVRDMGSIEDTDVSKRLSSWLGEQGELSLLVWFAKGGEEATPHFLVIMPPGKEHQPVFRTGMEALAGGVN